MAKKSAHGPRSNLFGKLLFITIKILPTQRYGKFPQVMSTDFGFIWSHMRFHKFGQVFHIFTGNGDFYTLRILTLVTEIETPAG